MPKQKSSASSATKKKHARKTQAREEQLQSRAAADEQAELDGVEQGAEEVDETAVEAVNEAPAVAEPAAPNDERATPITNKSGRKLKDAPPPGQSRGSKEAQEAKKKKKQNKKHGKGQAPPPPRKKQYIPPPKPPKTNIDPVDIYGLGVVGASYERIPADKVVSLRLLNKKDSMTVERGLDEVLGWINQVQLLDDTDNEEALIQIAETMPVWIHHLPRLLAHASRRVRYLTASIHSVLLHQGSPTLLSYTVPSFITPSSLEREDYLSCQLCATFDPDRQVRALSLANWKALSDLVRPQDYLEELLSSLTDTILESPAGLSAQEQAKRKLSDEERIALQEEKDRLINQLTATIEAFSSLLQYCTEDNATSFTKVTSSDSFWAFLSSKEMDAPQVRRAAWRTLSLILPHEQSDILLEQSLSTVSRVGPIAAFSERDHQTQNTLWEPLITLFRRYPSVWKRAIKSTDDDDDVLSESDSSSSSSEQETDASAAPPSTSKISHTIAAFFDALQVGFYGNAASGYQAAPLLLHSIPEFVFPRSSANIESLFSSFWGAYTGGAIDANSTQAFVRCLVDFVRISLVSDEAARIAANQLIRLWGYYLHITPPPTKYLSLSNSTTVQELEKGMLAVHTKYSDAFNEVWPQFSDLARQSLDNSERGTALADALVQLFRSSPEGLSESAQELLHDCVILAASHQNATSSSAFLLEALRRDGKELLATHNVQQTIDQYMLKIGPENHQLLMAYLSARGGSDAKTAVWKHACQGLHIAVNQAGMAPLLSFLQIFRSAALPTADYANAELDDLIIEHALTSLSSDAALRPALEILLHFPEPLASSDMPRTFLTRLVDYLEGQLASMASDAAYMVPQENVSTVISLLSLATPVQLYGTVAHYPAFVVIFQWAELVPRVTSLNSETEDQARQTYEKMIYTEGPWSLPDLYAMTAARLGELLLEKHSHISPVILSETFFKLCEMSSAIRSDLIMAYLPQEFEMARLAEPLFSKCPDSRLAVFDPLLQLHGDDAKTEDALEDTTIQLYRRSVVAWLSVLSENRRFGSQIDWIIPHSILVREFTGDALFTRPQDDAEKPDLKALNAVSDRVTVHLCSQSMSQVEETWQTETISALKNPQIMANDMSPPQRLLASLLRQILQSQDETYANRTFAACLAMLLHQTGANLKEKEAWLELAKHWQAKDIRICIAILSALSASISESSRLQRYQGEVASSLTSLNSVDLLESGVPQLRVLLALALASDADEDLLPSNRAIFLLQGLQKWKLFGSDADDEGEDDSEEVLDQAGPLILKICTQLVPAIQDLSGSHWDFMFDLAEYSIESFSWDRPSTYSGLAAACSFLEEMRNRSSINKAFKTLIRTSLKRTTVLLSPIFLTAPSPSDVTLALLLSMSPLLSGHDSFKGADLPTLFNLLARFSGASLAAVFELCSVAIRIELEELTLNAEVRRSDESAEQTPIGIPGAIIESLTRQSTNPPESDAESARMLLSWLLVCGFFQDTTTTLKTAFTEQVRKSNFVPNALLPTIFKQSDVNDRSRGLDLSRWHVQEFFVEDLDEQDPQGLSRLAAHAYYQTLRSVPSLVRSEWESIKSKQMSMSIETFTSRAFSPLLINMELARVHTEEAKGTLQDEEMSVKILPNVNEVKAVYTVDEQPMEIAIRIPPNFPLSPVEVRDVKRVGVPEATWRAWLLNVQLIISTQNGSIADALSLFKTNAARHFEGVEACAICYSVVSVTDRSMPTKRCRTCKQLFHPSCLYKWFATSHGSSCPLCRSLF